MGEKTGLNDAENGAKLKKEPSAEKNAKMRRVRYLTDWQSLRSTFHLQRTSSRKKRYIRVKKTQCLFFTRSLFFSKSQSFESRNRPF